MSIGSKKKWWIFDRFWLSPDSWHPWSHFFNFFCFFETLTCTGYTYRRWKFLKVSRPTTDAESQNKVEQCGEYHWFIDKNAAATNTSQIKQSTKPFVRDINFKGHKISEEEGVKNATNNDSIRDKGRKKAKHVSIDTSPGYAQQQPQCSPLLFTTVFQ